MAVRKLRSKIIWALVAVVLLLVLLIAALPLWFPWALRPMAKRYGVTYAQYQRLGYQRFRLSSFALTNGTTHLEAAQATAFVPTVWLWRHLTSERDERFLDVQSWKYEPGKSTSSQSTKPASVHHIFQGLQNVADKLNDWVPIARLTDGAVSIQKQIISIPEATWTNRNLAATLAVSNQPPFTIVADTKPGGAPWFLALASKTNALQASFVISNTSQELTLVGTADWLTNRFVIGAEFPPRGFIPDTASVNAESLTVPARLVGLKEYNDVHGALQATWQTNHFHIEIAANASPLSSNLPPVDVQLRASGDTNAARLDTAKISAPGLQLGLPTPVEISFRPPFLSQPTTLNVAADLDQQHWFVAHGKLAGQAVVYPGDKFPRVAFALTGTNIDTSSLSASNLQMSAELDWPVLDLKSAQIVMDDASQVSLSGKYDFTRKIIDDGQLKSSGPFGGQFLPAGYSFQTAAVTAQFSGPLNSLTNSAKAQVTHFAAPDLSPLDVEANWQGQGPNFKTAEVRLKAGDSSLLLRGSTSFDATNKILTLTALELSTSNKVELHLQQPARIALEKSATNSPWTLTTDPLQLTGDNRELRLAADVRWPERGAIQCSASNLDARLFSGFIPKANVGATLNRLALDAGWTNGPIAFQLTSDATLATREGFPFSATARITGDKTGISIQRLSVLSATQMVSHADGTLAVSFDPTRKDGMLQMNPDAPLHLHVSTDPRSVLWRKIAEATGLQLEQPNLAANLEGTWAAPKGEVTLRVRHAELSGGGRPLPAIDNVDFLAVMDRATARLSRCNFEVEKQPVTITGEIPLGESFWSGLRRKKYLPDWHQATAHLQIDHAQFAAFSSLLPPILSPEGTATADISLERGGNLRGELSVTNARTYPIESIGPVRNIQLFARLDGQTIQLENASGEIGGQRVRLDGSTELNQQIWRTNGLPLFHVHLNGTNVPLARNPSVLLRADLDLTVTNSGTAIPVVYGSVRLRDSLFLADLQTLVPERTASARKRPPYFSIETDPWSQWRLNVNVTGNSFLRVQTPLFQGKVSTVLSLQGTLKEPLALGQVKIDPGSSVTFPFSSLDVKQGFISLTSEDPYRPQLFVTAEARRFGYDVKMEATGPVDQPVLQFSSIPGLSSEEIVLMLTAGQIPRGVGATASTQQRAEGLALFVGKNLLSDFGLGGGGQERLTVRSGEDISESGRPTYDIEYKLTDRWSLIGEYDRFDQYNLNVKYKIYSK